MNEQDQVVEIAKVDEPNQKWEIFEDVYVGASEPYKKLVGYRILSHSGWQLAKDYLHSRDAIVPVRLKIITTEQLKQTWMNAAGLVLSRRIKPTRITAYDYTTLTAPEETEALLRATEKWKD